MVDLLFEDGPFSGRVLKNSPLAEQRKVFVWASKSDELYYLSRITYISLANAQGKGYTSVPTVAIYRHVKIAEVSPCS